MGESVAGAGRAWFGGPPILQFLTGWLRARPEWGALTLSAAAWVVLVANAASPAGVSPDRREPRVRCTSVVPTTRSSARIWWLIADWT